MTRSDSDSPPTSRRAPRQPLNWPTAVFGLGVLVLLGVMAWLCAGVAADIWGT